MNKSDVLTYHMSSKLQVALCDFLLNAAWKIAFACVQLNVLIKGQSTCPLSRMRPPQVILGITILSPVWKRPIYNSNS